MIYLIGGSSRSGKTTLALRMLSEISIPYFSTDFLLTGLAGATGGQFSRDDDDLETSGKLEKILTYMIGDIYFNSRPYVLEGAHLRPKYIRSMIDLAPNKISGCLLGYPNISVDEKLKSVQTFPATNDWLIEKAPVFQRRFLMRQIEISQINLREAQDANISFFCTDPDYNRGLDRAFEYMTEQ